MNRFLAPLALVLVAGTAAHAQTVTRTYTTADGFGNSTTTTVEVPTSAAGFINDQTIYGGFPNYSGGVPSYGASYPNYNYAGGYNYNYGYPAPLPYGYYPPQAYFVPGQTVQLGIPQNNWRPPTFTLLPQVVVPGVPDYSGYPNYSYSSRTVVGGSVNYNRGGLSVNVGGNSNRVDNPRTRPVTRTFPRRSR